MENQRVFISEEYSSVKLCALWLEQIVGEHPDGYYEINTFQIVPCAGYFYCVAVVWVVT